MVGRPLWHIPDPEHLENAQNEGLDLQHLHGLRKYFHLSFPKPIECRLSSRLPQADDQPWAAQRGLSFLTLCWSYIFSARLLEMQRRRVLYSQHSLQPQTNKTFRAKQGDVVVNLGASASHALVRWLCAILAPRPGWVADGGDFPPWAAFCSGDASFAISTDRPLNLDSKEPPPSSTQATELLIELCTLYGFGPEKNKNQRSEMLSPPMAAFLAAIALPFYRNCNLQPQFQSSTTLRRRGVDSACFGPLRQYVADLPYYMTLSMHSRSLGSLIWSIFWQPEIECNLVSPWLISILSVIRPITTRFSKFGKIGPSVFLSSTTSCAVVVRHLPSRRPDRPRLDCSLPGDS